MIVMDIRDCVMYILLTTTIMIVFLSSSPPIGVEGTLMKGREEHDQTLFDMKIAKGNS